MYQQQRAPSSQISPDLAPLLSLLVDVATVTDPLVLWRSSHVNKPPERYEFFDTLADTSISTSYSHAIKHTCWVKGMQEELQAFQENHTWKIAPCPNDVKPIWCKWVYSINLRFDGSLDRYKVRLITLDNRHECGIN